jgi:hypothetical protein
MGWVVSLTPRPRFTPGELTPSTHCTGGWVKPRAGLDTEATGKILRLCQGSNLDRPVVQSVARHYTAWTTRLTFSVAAVPDKSTIFRSVERFHEIGATNNKRRTDWLTVSVYQRAWDALQHVFWHSTWVAWRLGHTVQLVLICYFIMELGRRKRSKRTIRPVRANLT